MEFNVNRARYKVLKNGIVEQRLARHFDLYTSAHSQPRAMEGYLKEVRVPSLSSNISPSHPQQIQQEYPNFFADSPRGAHALNQVGRFVTTRLNNNIGSLKKKKEQPTPRLANPPQNAPRTPRLPSSANHDDDDESEYEEHATKRRKSGGGGAVVVRTMSSRKSGAAAAPSTWQSPSLPPLSGDLPLPRVRNVSCDHLSCPVHTHHPHFRVQLVFQIGDPSISYTEASVEDWLDYDCLAPLGQHLTAAFVAEGLDNVHKINAMARRPQNEINQFLDRLRHCGLHPLPWLQKIIINLALNHTRRGTLNRPRALPQSSNMPPPIYTPSDLRRFLAKNPVIPLLHLHAPLVELGVAHPMLLLAFAGLPAEVLDNIIPKLEDPQTKKHIHYKYAGALRIALDNLLLVGTLACDVEWRKTRRAEIRREERERQWYFPGLR